MRLDKFLKLSRIVKRRSVANELCDAGRVSLNGKTAKACSQVHENDIIALRKGESLLSYRVLAIPGSADKETAREMYEQL